ncbi:MAG: LytTR family DNA-binding domain-containing protein [Erythrobacter sp.]
MANDSAAGKPAIGARAALARRVLTDLAIMTVIGVFLAVIGPFGSIEEPLAVRLMTWLTFSYLGYFIYSPMSYVVERLHLMLDLPLAPLWFAAVTVATVPMTVLIFFIQFMPNRPPVPSLEEALTSYFYVFVIGGGVTLLFNFISAGGQGSKSDVAIATPSHQTEPATQDLISEHPSDPVAQAKEAGEAPTDNSANTLLDALPPELGSEIIALEMEDHYVRVHTALGSHLVLMRLRDAIAQIGDIDGRQVHRSWWVARLAVEDVKREGRNIRLVLAHNEIGQDSGRIEAPVSRAQVSELKAAGWI